MQKTFYEWDLEYFDPVTQDILDHHHESALKFFKQDDIYKAINALGNCSLVLVRDFYDGEGLENRSWAYVSRRGKLPKMFMDAGGGEVAEVPGRFHKELENYIANLKIF